MASNSFGNLFRITTFGESRGELLGVVIDGLPVGIAITNEEIQKDLDRRKPGRTCTSQRKEEDLCCIVSGLYQGKTTGAPLCILIANQETHSREDLSLLKPGHAAFAYFQKYGHFDPRGGGRASARETAARVAAGAVAKKILESLKVHIVAYLSQMGTIAIEEKRVPYQELKKRVDSSVFFCPDSRAEKKMKELIVLLQKEKESIGGVVSFYVENVPLNLGDPIYEKFQANLAKALMSIPGAKGFDIGEGFASAMMKGSEHNDTIGCEQGRFFLKSNHAGGVLGGITTGEPLFGRVAFKPASSIEKIQKTVNMQGEEKEISSDPDRNDLCIAIRACPVVEAMIALVLADSYLMHSALQI